MPTYTYLCPYPYGCTHDMLRHMPIHTPVRLARCISAHTFVHTSEKVYRLYTNTICTCRYTFAYPHVHGDTRISVLMSTHVSGYECMRISKHVPIPKHLELELRRDSHTDIVGALIAGPPCVFISIKNCFPLSLAPSIASSSNRCFKVPYSSLTM